MFPIRPERDIKLANWLVPVAGYGTTTLAAINNNIQARSDGVVYPDFGIFQVKAATVAVPVNEITAACVHIKSPEPGTEYTLYSYSAHAWCVDPQLMPLLFVAVSPTTITSNATGDVCDRWSLIGTADAIGDSTGFRALHREGTIGLPVSTGFNNDDAICFGIGFSSKGTITDTFFAFARLSVRRLVANEPTILDSTKLG